MWPSAAIWSRAYYCTIMMVHLRDGRSRWEAGLSDAVYRPGPRTYTLQRAQTLRGRGYSSRNPGPRQRPASYGRARVASSLPPGAPKGSCAPPVLGPVDLTARGASTACWLRGHRLMRTCFKASAAHHTYHRDGTHPPHIPRRSTRLKQVRPRWELCASSQQQQLLFRVCLHPVPSESPHNTVSRRGKNPEPRAHVTPIRRLDCSVCWGRGNLVARGWASIDERCNGKKGWVGAREIQSEAFLVRICTN